MLFWRFGPEAEQRDVRMVKMERARSTSELAVWGGRAVVVVVD